MRVPKGISPSTLNQLVPFNSHVFKNPIDLFSILKEEEIT